MNTYSYNTSGANETILVKFNCLNSWAIAPKIRVPFGFPSLLMTTAALSSYRIFIPLLRLSSLQVPQNKTFLSRPLCVL